MEQFLRLGVMLPPFLFIIGTSLIAIKWNIGRHASLCAHGTQSKETSVLFGIMTIILAAWHYAGWLLFMHPRLNIPYFYPLFLLATACILVISFVPTRAEHPKAKIAHSIAGALQGSVLVVLSALIVMNNDINIISRCGLIVFAVSVTAVSATYRFSEPIRSQAYVIEAVAICLFSASIALIAYTL